MMQALAIEDGIETIRQTMVTAKAKYELQKFGINGYCMGGTLSVRSVAWHATASRHSGSSPNVAA